jgi:hypothetical protein
MTITDTTTGTTPPLPPSGEPRRTTGAVVTRVGLTFIVLALVGMWVYAFGFAKKQGVYVLDDEAWTQRAQQICETYEAKRLELVDMDAGYIANPTEEQMIQRADVVDRATDILEAELAEVFAVLPESERDQKIASEYQGFYNVLIGDRRAYTERLRNFELGPYLETKIDGGPVTNILLDFTTANRMKRCAPPGELGGDAL